MRVVGSRSLLLLVCLSLSTANIDSSGKTCATERLELMPRKAKNEPTPQAGAKRTRAVGSSSKEPGTPLVPESPRSINRQAKLQRLLKQLHGQATVPEDLKTGDGDGPELRNSAFFYQTDRGFICDPGAAIANCLSITAS